MAVMTTQGADDDIETPPNLGQAIHERFSALDVNLPELPREAIRKPLDFGDATQRQPGSAKGLLEMASDFAEPLQDFEAYR